VLLLKFLGFNPEAYWFASYVLLDLRWFSVDKGMLKMLVMVKTDVASSCDIQHCSSV